MMLLNVCGTGKLCKKLQNMNNKCKTDMITTEKKRENMLCGIVPSSLVCMAC